jgi:hypothetical protein
VIGKYEDKDGMRGKAKKKEELRNEGREGGFRGKEETEEDILLIEEVSFYTPHDEEEE